MRASKKITSGLLFLLFSGSVFGQIDVTWTNNVGATISGTSLTKTATNGWGNAGAESVNLLQSNTTGYIEYTVPSASAGEFVFGFSDLNVDDNFYTVEYAIHRTSTSLSYVRLNGTAVLTFFAAPNDVLTIERTGVLISFEMVFKKNGNVIYTANSAQHNSLIVDASIYSYTGSITGLKASFPPAPIELITWGSMVGLVQTNAQTLTKTAANGFGNSGASSQNVIHYEEDGWVEFTLDSWNHDRMFGLSDKNIDNNSNSIDFAFYTSGTNIFVYENGVNRGSIPSAVIGDRFRITRLGDAIYWQRNGFTIYYHDQTYRGGLIADVALGTNGATLYNARSNFGVPGVRPGVVPNTPEYIAMMDMYNKMNGPNWQNVQNWPPTQFWPMNQTGMEGAHENDGFLHYVALANKNLNGMVPRTVWQLHTLRGVYLSENHITGVEDFTPPPQTWPYEIDLSFNEIEYLPEAFGQFRTLLILKLNNNKLKALPEFIPPLAPDIQVSLNNNDLTTLPQSILENEDFKVKVDSNYLDFSILEQVYDRVPGPQNQKKIRDVLKLTAVEGHSLVIPARPPGDYSTIQWEKFISGTWTSVLAQNDDATDETFTRNAPAPSDTGLYRWKMTNSVVTGVTLESEPIEVTYQTKITRAVENLGFQYHYDKRSRLIARKVPGTDWVYMVYDDRDRLVMTQDGQQRLSNRWTYTRYDHLNRPVMTGIYTHDEPVDQEEMTDLVGATTFSETFDVEEETNFGYSKNAFPAMNQNNFTVLTVTYYDDYSFIDLFDTESLGYHTEEIEGQYMDVVNEGGYFERTVGQVTGSVTAVLAKGEDNLPDNNRFLHAVNYYDDRNRLVQVISLNIYDAYDIVTTTYDFVGKVINRKSRQTGLDEHTVVRTFDYDHVGRPLKLWHQLDGGDTILLSMNSYNELGQLMEKGLHNTDGRNASDNARQFKQGVDFTYNIRGWLTGINNAALSVADPNSQVKDLFGMELLYNTADNDLANSPAHNGNISAMKWNGTGGVSQRAYRFEYDGMSRLLSAKQKVLTVGWDNTGDFAERDLQYDLNGNITRLVRTGENENPMDSLFYDYGEDGLATNQLRSVTDEYYSDGGFKDGNTEGVDYDYDQNGNMINDRNKNVKSISYNYLNLPETVKSGPGTYLRYVYDATGVKMQQLMLQPAGNSETEDDDVVLKSTDYLGDFVYENGQVRFANHEEGRVVLSGSDEIERLEGVDLDAAITYNATKEVDANNTLVVRPMPSKLGREAGLEQIGAAHNVETGESYVVKLRGTQDGTALSLRVTIGTNTRYLPVTLSDDAAVWKDFQVRVDETGSMIIGLVWESCSDSFMYLDGFILEKDSDLAEPEYQYHLKDHLGNVRMTFTTKEEVDDCVATMETTNEEEEFGRFLNYDKARVINHPVYDHTYDGQTPPNGTAFGIRLNGSDNERIGLARSLSVMPGDTLKVEVFAKYYEASGGDNLGAFATLMASIIGGTPPSGVFIDGAGYSINSATSVPFETELDKSGETGQRPKAYLNWLIFDRDYNVILSQSGYVRISTNAREDTTNIPHERLAPPADIVIKEAGYAYIWLSNENENPVEVYFDDFRVEHVKSPVIQSEDFYPFGLRYNSYSRENSLVNRSKLFQGQEHVDDLGLNWDSFKWRNHMPDIGRFFNVDPLAMMYSYNSPYAFSENDVVNSIELEGLEKFRVTNYSPMQSTKLKEEFEKVRGLRLYESVEDNEKISKSRDELDRIVEYGLKNGFNDPNGNKTDYLIKKLEESGMSLPALIKFNRQTTIIEKIEDGGDFTIEYYGVENNGGNISAPQEIGVINRSAEERHRRNQFFDTIFDQFPLPNSLFRIPLGPIFFYEPELAPPQGSVPNPGPTPNPNPNPNPNPSPPPSPPEPVVTRKS